MRHEHGHVVAATLIAAITLLFLGSLLAAILLRAAAQWVMKRQIEFWSAYSTIFYATLVNLGLGFFTGITARAVFPQYPGVFAWTQLGMVFVYFLVTAFFVKSRQKVTLPEAMLLCVCMYWLALVIVAITGVVVWRVLLWGGLL